jgi:hypothetical protein
MYSPEEIGINTPEDENIIHIKDNDVKTSVEKPAARTIINDEEIMNLKMAAKSPIVEIDSDKLIEFVINGLKGVKKLDNKVTLETIPIAKYDLILKKINESVLAKEKKEAKNDPLPDKKETENQINLDDELPVQEMEYAKPANTKNDNKKDKNNEEKSKNTTIENNNKDAKK